MSAEVVFLPTAEDSEQAKDSSRVLAQALANYSDDDRVRMIIQGSSGTNDELVLPGDIMNLLLNVLTQVSQGNAISLVPMHQEISTQQAADLLSVSRPHLVKLLEQGNIPFRKVGSHRRVKLTDVMDYRGTVDKERSKTLDELSQLSQDIGRISDECPKKTTTQAHGGEYCLSSVTLPCSLLTSYHHVQTQHR